MAPREFQIVVPDAILTDLMERLERVRLPIRRTPGPRWSAGTDIEYLRELVSYWRAGFDWKSAERDLNDLPHFLADVNGTSVHFVHLRGVQGQSHRPPIPLILTHGWPYSFREMLPLAQRLASPARYGADPAVVFDVVVPSLPGYIYSAAPSSDAPVVGPTVADMWFTLMTDVLGYPRFGTYGEDVGATVSDWLAVRHPNAVLGIHATHAAYPPRSRRADLTDEETRFFARLESRWEGETAYSDIQSTRPDTLAAALSDSPSGLAAWMVEKFRDWSDCNGDIERRFDKDELLTTVTLYWTTNSIATSFRSYFDARNEPELPFIEVPAGISVNLTDLELPRHLVERTYKDIRFWNELPAGAHFTAKEEPDLVAADIRAFFGPLQ